MKTHISIDSFIVYATKSSLDLLLVFFLVIILIKVY